MVHSAWFCFFNFLFSFFFQTGSNYGTLTRQPKIFLRAHLPYQQRTSVQVIPGLRLRDALQKALKRRNLTCDMCEVTVFGNDVPIAWDTDISLIQAEEVYVKVLEKVRIMTHISHQVGRNLFTKNWTSRWMRIKFPFFCGSSLGAVY